MHNNDPYGHLLDRAAIQDCLVRGGIGNDMLDAELWKSAYWPEADEDHAWYRGNAHAFVDQTVPMLRQMDAVWHQLGNTLIRLDGERAEVQSYFFTYCRLADDDGARRDLFAGGRYLDRMEKRDGEWRIAERLTKTDWIRQTADSNEWGVPAMGGYVPNLGTRAPDDPLYAWFGPSLQQALRGNP